MSDKKPTAKIDLFPVSVAIWTNQSAKGVFYSTGISSRYKDADGKWRNTVMLNENELLLAAKALDMAHTKIQELRASRNQTETAD